MQKTPEYCKLRDDFYVWPIVAHVDFSHLIDCISFIVLCSIFKFIPGVRQPTSLMMQCRFWWINLTSRRQTFKCHGSWGSIMTPNNPGILNFCVNLRLEDISRSPSQLQLPIQAKLTAPIKCLSNEVGFLPAHVQHERLVLVWCWK